MMLSSLALPLLLLGASLPCPAPAPNDEPVSVAAQATADTYVDVGEEELAQGATTSALTAFAAALGKDPKNARARARWNTLCKAAAEAEAAATDDEADMAAAVSFYEKGELGQAAERFARLRERVMARPNGTPDPQAALLEGICRYELGEDARAKQLLLVAQKDPASRDSATIFLGLIALRNTQEDVAANYFQAVSSDDQSALHKDALSLLRLARQSGRVVFTLLASGGYDSNSDLLPDNAPSSPFTVAGPAVDFVGSFLVRPEGESGPFARALATFRKDLIPDTDQQGSVSAGVGWQFGRNPRHFALEYSLDFIEVGGETFALSHRGHGALRWTAGRLGFGVLLNARWLDYRYSGFTPYTGGRLEPLVEVRYRAGAHLFRVAGRHTRAATSVTTNSFDALGFEVSALFDFAPVRLLLEPYWEVRRYDVFDPLFGVLREDRALGAVAGLDWDLGMHWTWQWTFTARYTLSTAPVQTSRFTLWTGVSYTLGVL